MEDLHKDTILQRPYVYEVEDVLGVLIYGHRFTNNSKEDFRSMSLDENLAQIIIQESDDEKREFYKKIKEEAKEKELDLLSIKNNKVSDFLISKIRYIYIQKKGKENNY